MNRGSSGGGSGNTNKSYKTVPLYEHSSSLSPDTKRMMAAATVAAKKKIFQSKSSSKSPISTSTSSSSSSTSTSKSLLLSYIRITGVVALYWFVSITMVFLNKQILSGSQFSLDAPLFITWFQCMITLWITITGSVLANSPTIRHLFCCFGGAGAGCRAGGGGSGSIGSTASTINLSLSSSLSSSTSTLSPPFIPVLPRLRFRLKTVRQVLPLSIVFVAMISFNNLCLKNVGVAFYFVGRSLTTVFNVALTYWILGKRTSLGAIICCGAIVFGFFLGIDQEQLIGTLSISGVIFGVLASFFVSLNSILTSTALASVQQSIWLLTFYNNALACILFIPLMIATGECSELIRTATTTTLFVSPIFWSLMLLAGLFGFAISYVTQLQIQYTSPLTHNISGTAKACAQTVLATRVYVEHKTLSWWLSNVIVLVASACYTRVRQLEMAATHTQQQKHRQYRKLQQHQDDEYDSDGGIDSDEDSDEIRYDDEDDIKRIYHSSSSLSSPPPSYSKTVPIGTTATNIISINCHQTDDGGGGGRKNVDVIDVDVDIDDVANDEIYDQDEHYIYADRRQPKQKHKQQWQR